MRHYILFRAFNYIPEMANLKTKHHAGCMFCQGITGPTSDKGERCQRCKTQVEQSQLLYDGLQQVLMTFCVFVRWHIESM